MIAVYFLPWLVPGFSVPHEWSAPEIQRHDELLQQLWQQVTLCWTS